MKTIYPKPCLWVGACFLLLGQFAQAQLIGLDNAYEISGAPILCTDDIFVTLEMYEPNSCTTYNSYSVSSYTGSNQISITINANYTPPPPDCFFNITYFTETAILGKLPPGIYTVKVLNVTPTTQFTIEVVSTSNCVEPSVIDVNHTCFGNNTVCGCNGVTYADGCTAFYKHGVTSWTNGACANPCVSNPVVPAIAGATTICTGASTTLTASATGSTSPYTYAWSNSASGATNTVSPAATTTYTVTVTSNAGCTATASRTVTVVPPIVVGNVNTNALTGTFTVSGGVPQTNGSNYASVIMSLQGNPGVTGTLTSAPFTHNEVVSFTAPQTGTYTVMVTDGNGCSGTGTVFVSIAVGGQDTIAPCIEWQKTLGGSGFDEAYSIQQTNDNGFVVTGYTNSNDGVVTGNHGSIDAWVIKLTVNGIIEWQKTLGGTGDDIFNCIQQTNDGGFVAAGSSTSNNGDVFGNHGSRDVWVVKLTATGIIEWQKALGGSGIEIANSIQQTIDGGFVIAGATTSNDGDVFGNHGSVDSWIIKLNTTGIIEWQKTLGGNDLDILNSVQQTNDGGFVAAGSTISNDGDVTGNHGGYDAWVIKLLSNGTIDWQKTFGVNNDDRANTIQQTTDGGYVVAGQNSTGYGNFWIIKLTVDGNIQWQKDFGGFNEEWAFSIHQSIDGGFVVTGRTASNDIYVLGNHGDRDVWAIKLTAIGNLQWQKTLGGSNLDEAFDIKQTSDNNGLIIAGYTESSDGDVTENNGNRDFWIIKLGTCSSPCTTVTTTADAGPNSLREAITCANTNPGPDTIRFDIPGAGPHSINLLSALPTITDDSTIIDASTQPNWTLGKIAVNGTSLGLQAALSVQNNTGFALYGLVMKNTPANAALELNDCNNFKIGAAGRGNAFYGNAESASANEAHQVVLQNVTNGFFQGNIIGLTENYIAPLIGYNTTGLAMEGLNIQIGGSRSLNEGNIFGRTYFGTILWDLGLPGNNFTPGNINI